MAVTTDDTTDETEEREERTDASGSAPRRRVTGRIAMAVSVFGELLITAGLILGLFVVYSLWWTNVLADREAGKQADKVRDDWARTDDGVNAKGTPADAS